jgi:DNA polymerase-3 subunit epsilon
VPVREVVLDTETTGLDPFDGHRIIEIGCVELFDHLPTGRTFQVYLNPERLVSDSERVHGITDAFLANRPIFGQIAGELLDFLGDAPLVMHNAAFDLKFLNHELQRILHPPVPFARAIDTMEIAKSRIPGARYSLDELCRRFGVDLSRRAKHGALLDAQLTAQVYLELVGGRQIRLKLAPLDVSLDITSAEFSAPRTRPEPLPPRLDSEALAIHTVFITAELGNEAIWNWA